MTWHPSSRLLLWTGWSRTCIVSLIDGSTSALLNHGEVGGDADDHAAPTTTTTAAVTAPPTTTVQAKLVFRDKASQRDTDELNQGSRGAVGNNATSMVMASSFASATGASSSVARRRRLAAILGEDPSSSDMTVDHLLRFSPCQRFLFVPDASRGRAAISAIPGSTTASALTTTSCEWYRCRGTFARLLQQYVALFAILPSQ